MCTEPLLRAVPRPALLLPQEEAPGLRGKLDLRLFFFFCYRGHLANPSRVQHAGLAFCKTAPEEPLTPGLYSTHPCGRPVAVSLTGYF